VVTARAQGNETVVASGLQAGEQVVTDGQARLVAGAKVEVRAPSRPGGGERPREAGGGPPKSDGVKGPARAKDAAGTKDSSPNAKDSSRR